MHSQGPLSVRGQKSFFGRDCHPHRNGPKYIYSEFFCTSVFVFFGWKIFISLLFYYYYYIILLLLLLLLSLLLLIVKNLNALRRYMIKKYF